MRTSEGGTPVASLSGCVHFVLSPTAPEAVSSSRASSTCVLLVVPLLLLLLLVLLLLLLLLLVLLHLLLLLLLLLLLPALLLLLPIPACVAVTRLNLWMAAMSLSAPPA